MMSKVWHYFFMSTDEKPASQQIDDIIKNSPDWRGKTLAKLRAIIMQTDSNLVEEVKWKKPSRPEGVAVWSYNGNICIADILKNAVRLTFPKGSQLKDPKKIFNTRLDSKTVRAIDFYEAGSINAVALKSIVLDALKLN